MRLTPRSTIIAITAFMAPVGAAQAEVTASAPGGFTIARAEVLNSTSDAAWAGMITPEQWWNPDHTYSGNAAALTLLPDAGGCFCEVWDGNSVEHARVVMAMRIDGAGTLRMVGGLGPLQGMGVSGVLTFSAAPAAGGTSLSMEYRVTGEPEMGLDGLAPVVDAVMSEQFDRLARYISGGGPEAGAR